MEKGEGEDTCEGMCGTVPGVGVVCVGGRRLAKSGGPVSKDLVYNMFTHYFVESAHCKHWE